MAAIAALKDYVQFGLKTEAVEGTAETLVAAQFAVPAYDPEVKRSSTQTERRPVATTSSALQSVESRKIGTGKVVLEVAPTGALTDPPIFPALLSSGGATGTGRQIKWGHEATSVVRGSAATFQFEDGTFVRKLVGARSTIKFRPNDKGILVAELSMQGGYTKASGAFTSAVALSTLRPAVVPGSVLSLAGAAVQFNDVEINIEGNLVTLEDYSFATLAGQTILENHKQTASITVFETGTPDWEDKQKNLTAGDLMAFSWALGSGTNNILTFAGSLCCQNVERIYVGSAAAYKIDGEFVRNGSNGALTFTQT